MRPVEPFPDGFSVPGIAGRTAVVTGGSRGIGRAIALGLQRQGADVATLDIEEPVIPEEETTKYRYVRCDVSNEDSVDEAFSTVERTMGPASMLINNAGILRSLSLEDTTHHDWTRIMDVNLTGAFLCARRALPAMREAGYGRVVTVGSNAGKTGGYQNLAAYAASKGGVMTLARSIAREYAGAGVTSNAIAPAAIETDMIADLSGFADSIPVGRLGTPADVAAVAVFLCSSAAGFITGEVVDVNGGFMVD